MPFSNEILMRIAISIFGLCGFMVAKHIRNHKVKGEILVCPIRFDCNTVVNSDYSKFFGIPVEILGMGYYAFIFFSYLAFIFLPSALPHTLIFFMLIVSKVAFIFSVYLIGVQIFALKKGCSWCIVSALISALIFFLTVFK